MHLRLKSLFVLPLALLLIAADAPKTVLIKPDAVDVLQLLPDPPSKDSAEQQRELELVLRIQETRSDEEIARATSENKFAIFAFSDVIGPWFTAENCPKTAELFTQIDTDSKYFTKLGKDHWARPRPPAASDKVKPLSDEKDASYPSGHSTRATLFAGVLMELFPDQKAALLERSRQIGWDRVIGGVHYPSDVFAGRTLGQALARGFLTNPEVQSQLTQIRAELDQARAKVATAAVSASH